MSKKKKKLKRILNSTISDGVPEDGTRRENHTIWICWLQGFDNTPLIVSTCINTIERVASSSNYTIEYITEDNLDNYIELPSFILEKRKKGIIGSAHFSDIIRTELLCRYGGLWVDATVLFTSDTIPSYIENCSLFVFQDINWGNRDTANSVLSNWLIYSESNNPILLLTRKMLFQYWRRFNYPMHYFIYHIFFTLATERYAEEWKRVPTFSNEPPRILSRELNCEYTPNRWNQILQMSDVHKLKWRVDYNDENSMLSFIIKQYCK